MRWEREIQGHELEIVEHYEQGGGVEEIILWCHTCDPTGEAPRVYAHQDFAKWRVAFATANEDAVSHANKGVPLLQKVT